MSFLDRLRISSLDQPNIFVLNVRTADIDTIRTLDTGARLYDTILGRIDTTKKDPEFAREFNITTVDLTNSPIVQGTALMSGGVSLDQDFAKRLGV
jgi:hypothetical protein